MEEIWLIETVYQINPVPKIYCSTLRYAATFLAQSWPLWLNKSNLFFPYIHQFTKMTKNCSIIGKSHHHQLILKLFSYILLWRNVILNHPIVRRITKELTKSAFFANNGKSLFKLCRRVSERPGILVPRLIRRRLVDDLIDCLHNIRGSRTRLPLGVSADTSNQWHLLYACVFVSLARVIKKAIKKPERV